MIHPADILPENWTAPIGCGDISLGHDVATTDKKTSNPSSLTVTEKQGRMFYERLILRWKTPDPDIARAIIRLVIEALPRNQLRAFCVDASNEKYHAANLRKEFRTFCPVHLIVSGEAIEFEGNRFSYKTLLGDLYCTQFEEGCITLPPGQFIISDHRLVKKQSGTYQTDLDEAGNHGDTFDSGKLSLWGHLRTGGPVRAHAAAVGSLGAPPSRPGLIGPVGRSFAKARRTLNA
jgi:hypothetical protein